LPGANGDRAVSRARSVAVVCGRCRALASGMVAPLSGARDQAVKFMRFDAVTAEMVEIVIGDVVVRVGSDVEPDRLAAVIRAVWQA
jgi:transposase